jgi:putative transposase
LARGWGERAGHQLRAAGTASPSIWQPRYWEHVIRDEDDFERYLDYIRYNPVKHGLVEAPRDWPYSSFHRWVRQGAYDPDWGRGNLDALSHRFLGLERTVGE